MLHGLEYTLRWEAKRRTIISLAISVLLTNLVLSGQPVRWCVWLLWWPLVGWGDDTRRNDGWIRRITPASFTARPFVIQPHDASIHQKLQTSFPSTLTPVPIQSPRNSHANLDHCCCCRIKFARFGNFMITRIVRYRRCIQSNGLAAVDPTKRKQLKYKAAKTASLQAMTDSVSATAAGMCNNNTKWDSLWQRDIRCIKCSQVCIILVSCSLIITTRCM